LAGLFELENLFKDIVQDNCPFMTRDAQFWLDSVDKTQSNEDIKQ
jgi:hypothetical protein